MEFLGLSELTEIIVKVGFVTSVCVICLYVALKSINYWFELRKKNDSSSIKKDQTITSAFLDGEKVKTDLIISDKREASELLTREREELKQRLSVCENDLKGCNLYIRDKLTGLLEENIQLLSHINNSIDHVNTSILAQQKAIADLQAAIGKIKEIKVA